LKVATKSLVVSPTLVADAASMLVRAWACCGAVSVCEASTWGSPQRLTHLRVQAHHHQQKGASPHAQVQEEATAFLLAFVFAITGILGIANAPAAQASESTNFLESVYANHGSNAFNWTYARPTIDVTTNGFRTLKYENWRKARVHAENAYGGFYDPTGQWWYCYVSLNYGTGNEAWSVSSVKMYQAMLNRWRELGYGSGSYLTLDGDLGPASDARIKQFQTWWFGSGTSWSSGHSLHGSIDSYTWDALADWLGY